MKILFWSGKLGNSGPPNVTKQYLRHLNASFDTVYCKSKYGELLEGAWKLLFADVVVVSGVSRKGCLLVGLAQLLRKKSVYIMHGCAAYERLINETSGLDHWLKQEAYLLKNADLLLPVSQKFMYWVQEHYLQYAYKTKYLFNGIDKELLPQYAGVEKIPDSIIAAGGDRKQKANYVLADAVESMGGNAWLCIYGGLSQPAPNYRYQHVKYMGKIPQQQFTQRMAQSSLLVLNSVFEPFSLAAIEALMCGCSVLISEVAGVTDLLTLEETDIIHDPMNVDEIKSKIEYLLEHPNNERILSKLDIEEYSYPRQVQKLEAICRELVQK